MSVAARVNGKPRPYRPPVPVIWRACTLAGELARIGALRLWVPSGGRVVVQQPPALAGVFVVIA